jgi:hypothetical protein
MSAEIGGYQGEYGPQEGEGNGPDYTPQFLAQRAVRASIPGKQSAT